MKVQLRVSEVTTAVNYYLAVKTPNREKQANERWVVYVNSCPMIRNNNICSCEICPLCCYFTGNNSALRYTCIQFHVLVFLILKNV